MDSYFKILEGAFIGSESGLAIVIDIRKAVAVGKCSVADMCDLRAKMKLSKAAF